MLKNTVKYILAFVFVMTFAGKPAKSQDKDTLQEFPDTVSLLVKHSPAKAAFLSAVVPGLGQIYNGKGLWWRLPILYAGIAFETYMIYDLNKTYQDFHKGYVEYTNYLTSIGSNSSLYDSKKVGQILGGLGFPSWYSSSYSYSTVVTSTLKTNNDNFRQWRDLNVLIMAGIYFINIVDATVQAYFFEYDVSDNLTLKVRPTLMDNSISRNGTFGMKLSFNLH